MFLKASRKVNILTLLQSVFKQSGGEIGNGPLERESTGSNPVLTTISRYLLI